jgi:DNA-binding transcriptional LysR family regulator
MINLRQLECFRALAEELNFTRAAEKLNMAQPPLSRQIKLLEDTLGVMLFERTKRSVRLTPEGDYLKKEIGQTFRQLDHVKANLKQMREGRSGVISIGYVGAAMHSVLPGILKKFLSAYKHVNLRLYELDNIQQLEALKKGTIDIGFLRSRLNDTAIELMPVYEEAFSLVVPRNIKLRSVKSADLKILRDLPFIGFPMSCAPDMVKSIHNILGRLNLEPKQIHESSQINSIIRIVESGVGYSILPGSVKEAYNVGVNMMDLSRIKERAIMYVGVNRDRRPLLVQNMLGVIP